MTKLAMPTKYALDCEMVESGRKSILARVSIVDEKGRVIIDTFVKPTDVVTDYRVIITGITWGHLENGVNINVVRDKVRKLLRGCILVGHSLHFDLAALGLEHPIGDIRDLAKYEPFTRINNNQPTSLKLLAILYLRKDIQMGEHCSVEDAQASMAIYKKVESEWEERIESYRIREVFQREYSFEYRNTYPPYRGVPMNNASDNEISLLSIIVLVGIILAVIYFTSKQTTS